MRNINVKNPSRQPVLGLVSVLVKTFDHMKTTQVCYFSFLFMFFCSAPPPPSPFSSLYPSLPNSCHIDVLMYSNPISDETCFSTGWPPATVVTSGCRSPKK